MEGRNERVRSESLLLLTVYSSDFGLLAELISSADETVRFERRSDIAQSRMEDRKKTFSSSFPQIFFDSFFFSHALR
jgi:hypothetical protein